MARTSLKSAVNQLTHVEEERFRSLHTMQSQGKLADLPIDLIKEHI